MILGFTLCTDSVSAENIFCEVKHFHSAFTIPAELNQLVLQNPPQMFGLLFSCAAATVKELTEAPNYLGATISFTSILHTWGSNMSFHPYIHMVVTAGGITLGGKWKDTRGKFFLPVHVLSALFKGKFLAGCRALYDKGELTYKGSNKNALSHRAFADFLNHCYKKDWVVYAKVPFNVAEGAFEYLGRDTHSITITPHPKGIRH